MIVIKVEMWPAGVEEDAYPLGRMYIWNKANKLLHMQSKGKRGDYSFVVMKKNKATMPHNEVEEIDTTANGEVDNWPRLSYSVWKLVLNCLKQAFEGNRDGRSRANIKSKAR